MTMVSLTLRSLTARKVNVEMSRPLQTSSGVIRTCPLVLIDLQTEEGLTGRSYLFCYAPLALAPVASLVQSLEASLRGDPVAPLAIEQKLQRQFRLLGPQGLTGMAMAGIDMAAWDALAKAAGLALVRLLGGAPRPIPAYDSLGMNGLEVGMQQAAESVAAGFKALKVKIGYPDLRSDLEVIRGIRGVIGAEAQLMVDYNQSLPVPEAIRRIRALDDEGLAWIEEPTLHDDFAGHARIAREARTAIQLGENWWGPHDLAKSLAAGASDLAMPDVMKIGGVTGWLRMAALTEAAGLPVSSHIFPEFSAHLLAVTPSCHWLEYMDLANPILAQPTRIQGGLAQIPETPGAGVEWNEEAVRRFLVP
jgi:mandelate racemase